MLSWTKVLAFLVVTAMLVSSLLLPRQAFAQKPVSVHVIALDSDDASEDHADALTAAMRQRVRNTPSLQLAESNQSLATLLPALKCPQRPDSACLQRIGDQLKTDRFFWGNVIKAGAPHQVVAEVHLWTRGKPEQVAKETYSDNLKDQNDDALKRIAAQLFERLTGQSTQGSVLVHVNGSQVGTVVVDGKPQAQLAAGQATLQLGSGTHTIDIQAEGMTTTAQTVSVVVNVQSEVTFELKANVVAPVEPSKPSHIKKTIGFIVVGVAGASAIVGAVFGGLYAGDASTWHNFASGVPSTVKDTCSNGLNQGSFPMENGISYRAACNARSNAQSEGTLGWTFAGVAAGLAVVGVILIVTDHPSKEEGSPSPPATSLRILPTFGPNGGGVSALLTF